MLVASPGDASRDNLGSGGKRTSALVLPLSFKPFGDGDVNSMPVHTTGPLFFDPVRGITTLHLSQETRPAGVDGVVCKVVLGCDTSGECGTDADRLGNWYNTLDGSL